MPNTVVYRMRKGSVQGVRHVRLGINNQDAVLTQVFGVPKWGKTYRVALTSDGVSGMPAFTRSEVGSNIMVVYCLAKIQELIVGGVKLEEIPLPLYHAMTSFLRDFANMIMPPNIYWPFPIEFKGSNEYRNHQKATQRFMADYLAATLIGFIDDGQTLVTFQAGDGTIIVNDNVLIVDQNDRPAYPSMSVNSPGGGFATNVYHSEDVLRIALASDGIEKLLPMPELGLPLILFSDNPDDPLGLQYLLNRWRRDYGEMMDDDCTVAAMERLEGENNDSATT